MTITANTLKKTLSATYNQSEDARYAILEDDTVIRVKNHPDFNSLIVYRMSDNKNLSVRYDARQGEPISEKEFCEAVQDYFTAIKFPCQIKL